MQMMIVHPFKVSLERGIKNNRIAGMMAFFPRLKIVSFQRVFHWQRWELSEDGKFLLIVHDTIQIFRHSSLAKYTIVSLKDRYIQHSFEIK